MITLMIDDKETTVDDGTLIIEAAKRGGIEIPHFCYHPKLSISGSCRMCLVEVEGVKKLVTACTTPVSHGMVVKTRSKSVKEAQKGMLAFLLVNHPLDCPVCDKGGECPLQDYTYRYGPSKSLFIDEKWHFDKPVDLSKYIVIDRERCILCTRCVRFQEEVAMHPELGIVDRGRGSYIVAKEGGFTSNYSGNTIELCPVGALTSRPYRFKARPWELKRTPSICPHCGCGCNIYLDIREDKVMRVLARENPAVDDGWLCDRGRFGYLFVNHPDRLKTPLIRRSEGLVPCTWDEAVSAIVEGLKDIKERYRCSSIGGLAAPMLANEDLYIFHKFIKDMAESENVWYSLDRKVDRGYLDAALLRDFRKFSFTDIDEAECIFIIDGDPARDLPILDLRIKKAVRRGARLYTAGGFPDELRDSKRSVILLGSKIESSEAESLSLLLAELQNNIKDGWISAGIMHPDANTHGAQDIGIKSHADKPVLEKIRCLFVAQMDIPDIKTLQNQVDFLIVYDLFLSDTAKAADIVLPAAAFSEIEGSYTNTEGRVQRLYRAAIPPCGARQLRDAIMAIASGMGIQWPYQSSEDIMKEMKTRGIHV